MKVNSQKILQAQLDLAYKFHLSMEYLDSIQYEELLYFNKTLNEFLEEQEKINKASRG